MTRAALTRGSAVLLAFVLLASSCGSSDTAAEIAAIQADSDAAIAEANEQLAAAETAAEEARDALTDAEATIDGQAAAIEQLDGRTRTGQR